MLKKSTLLLGILSILLPATLLAEEVNLYDQPQDKAKVVGKVDLSAGIVPIYSPKDGGWIKVGDPRNGNTGWIKSDTLKSKTGISSFSFKQTVNDDSSPVTYQFFQTGPQKLTEQQQKELLKEIQTRQQLMQQNLQRMYQELNTMAPNWNMPMVMPVVFVPVKVAPKAAAPTTTNKQVQQQIGSGKEDKGNN